MIKSINKSLIYSLLISLTFALVVQHRVFVDSTAINDDVRNQIYWMAKFIDPNYFSNDYIAAYFSQPSMISPILGLIYKYLAPILDPKIISQALPFIIIPITTFFLFKATEIHAGPRYAFWICYAFNLYIWTMKFIAGGLPRSFFYLLFFLFLWLLVKRSWSWLLACIGLQTLIYPTCFFLSLLVLIIEIIADRVQQIKFDFNKAKALVMTIVIGSIILSYRYLYHKLPDFGSLTNLKEALKMPEFYYDGRVPVFIVPYNQAGFSLLELISNNYLYIVLLLAVVLIGYWLHKVIPQQQASPRYLWSSVIASLLAFIIAYLALFYLYLPHRYIAYVLPLVPVFIFGTLAYGLEIKYKNKPIIIWALALIVLVGIYSDWDDDLIKLGRQQRKLLEFISSTPRDSLIAAPLKFASNIPVFSYRSVLISSEANIPFHKTYYQEVQNRIEDLDEVYQAQDWQSVINFIDKYGIDYIVVNQKHINKLEVSVFKDIPEDYLVFETKKYKLIQVNSKQ